MSHDDKEGDTLWGWGSNDKFRLGAHADTKNHFEPTQIPFFTNKNRFTIQKISAGQEHSFVYVEEFNAQKISMGNRLYQIGNDKSSSQNHHRGVTKNELKEQNNIARVSFFDNLLLKVIAAGTNTSFVLVGKKDESVPVA